MFMVHAPDPAPHTSTTPRMSTPTKDAFTNDVPAISPWDYLKKGRSCWFWIKSRYSPDFL